MLQFPPHVRDFDWASTPLGAIVTWSQDLRLLVAQMCAAPLPTLIAWGPDLIQVYNTKAAEMLGDLHPVSLGQSLKLSSPEAWREVGHIVQAAMRGDSAVMRHRRRRLTYQNTHIDRFFDAYLTPALTAQGEVGGVQIVYVESTQAVRERLLAEAARAEKDRLKDLLEDAPAYIAVVRGPEHVFEIANKQIARLAGDRVLIGRRLADAVPEIVEQGFVALLDQVYATGKAVKASRSSVRLRDGSEGSLQQYYFDFVHQPTRGPDGEITGVMIMGTDVTPHVAAAAAQQLLVHELNHRVKNTLAVVVAIARLSGKTAASIDDFTAGFAERIEALAATHDMLTQGGWTHVAVRRILEQETAPFANPRDRIVIDCADLDIPGPAAIKLCLIIHEFATNAAKYGALSTPQGALAIGVARDGETIVITWNERGGAPLPAESPHRGFGTLLVTRMVADLGGQAVLTRLEDGFDVRLTFPAKSLTAPA